MLGSETQKMFRYQNLIAIGVDKGGSVNLRSCAAVMFDLNLQGERRHAREGNWNSLTISVIRFAELEGLTRFCEGSSWFLVDSLFENNRLETPSIRVDIIGQGSEFIGVRSSLLSVGRDRRLSRGSV